MKIKSLPVLTFFIAALAKYTMSKYLLIEINQGETSGMFFIQSILDLFKCKFLESCKLTVSNLIS